MLAKNDESFTVWYLMNVKKIGKNNMYEWKQAIRPSHTFVINIFNHNSAWLNVLMWFFFCIAPVSMPTWHFAWSAWFFVGWMCTWANNEVEGKKNERNEIRSSKFTGIIRRTQQKWGQGKSEMYTQKKVADIN